MTGATLSGLQREAPPRMSRRGYRAKFRIESFPNCQGLQGQAKLAAACARPQTPAADRSVLCMPYGLWLRVSMVSMATTIHYKRMNSFEACKATYLDS